MRIEATPVPCGCQGTRADSPRRHRARRGFPDVGSVSGVLFAETLEDLDQTSLQDLVGLEVAHPHLAFVLHTAADGAADLLPDLVPREGRLQAAEELVEALVPGGLEGIVVGELPQRGVPAGVAVLLDLARA